MQFYKQIPNLLTLSNLFCGCCLVINLWMPDKIQATFGSFLSPQDWMLFFVVFSLVADFLDGFTARWLNAQSPIGLQLDSLADMVTFGVFPGMLMMKMIGSELESPASIWAFFGLSITLFSAYRLAKFNVDDEQSYYFKGLAVPANTILILGIYLWRSSYSFSPTLLISISLISSFLLVSDIPLFSLKPKSWKLQNLVPQIILLVFGLFLLLILGLKALLFIILFYILLSLIFRKKIIL